MKTSDINNLGNAYRSIYEVKTKEEVSDNKDFKPHMMYDPETGKGYKAEKPEDHERMSKMGYTHEEPDLVKEKKLPRQMIDPKKDVMVVKNNKVLVVDKSKEKEYLKKGWGLAEQIDEAKVLDNMSQLPKGIEVHRPLKSMQQVKKDADLSGMEITHIVKNKQGNKVVAAVISNAKYNFVYVNNKGVAPLAEQVDDIDERMKFGKRLKVGDIVYTDDGGKYIKGKITKIIGKHDRDSGTFEVKLKSGKVVKRNLDQMAADDDIMEATLGGTNAPSGETYMGDKGIQKMVALSKKNPNIKYTVMSDNYGEFKPHWLKNGKFAKRTVANINFDMDKNAVRGVPKGNTVKSTIFILRYNVNEAVSPEQQAAIAINKKEKEKMKNEEVQEGYSSADRPTSNRKIKRPKQGDYKNYIDLRPSKLNAPGGRDKVKYTKEGSVKDLAMKIDRVVAKMKKDSKLKQHAKKFASMAMDTMDIEKSLEKSLPSSVSGAVMIGLLEKKKEQEEMTKLGKGLRLNQKDKTKDEALDPVDNKAVDKKFKDRKDKDIDNDGDVDDSDEYLHNRRAKVDDAIDAKKKEKKENMKPKKKKLKASADANFEPMSDVAKSPKTAEIEKIGEEFIAMLEAALKSDGKDKDGKKLSKDALEDEEYHEKEPKKGKDFIAKHKKSDKSLEDKESEASDTVTNDDPMGKTKKNDIGTKPKSGKRPQDDNSGDTNIVKSTEAPIKEGSYENPLAGKGYPAQENNEEPIPSVAVMAQKELSGDNVKMDLVQMAVKHMNGEKIDFTKKETKQKNPYDGRMKLAREFMKRMDKRRGIEASVKTPKVDTAIAPQETLNKNGEK